MGFLIISSFSLPTGRQVCRKIIFQKKTANGISPVAVCSECLRKNYSSYYAPVDFTCLSISLRYKLP